MRFLNIVILILRSYANAITWACETRPQQCPCPSSVGYSYTCRSLKSRLFPKNPAPQDSWKEVWFYLSKKRYIHYIQSVVTILLTLSISSCTQSNEPIRTVQIQQTWQLQPGDQIASHLVVAGLGDVSIALKGDQVYAPFAGRVQPNLPNCVIFSSPELPAYLLRLCGLEHPKLGLVKSKEAIGSGEYLHFATLRKEQEGTWSMVEPARNILEQMLTKP